MAKVIKFPPDLSCQLCQIKMRPATQGEIKKGLEDPDFRHFYGQAVQGYVDQKLLINDVPDWALLDLVPASWLMMCDLCGGEVLWSKEEGCEDF